MWGRYWGWVLVGPREEISMGRRVEEKIRKNRWNQLQNSLRKWNSKKLRAIVQHCGFLSKYDSPCARREKIGGLQRTRVQFLMKNDVPMKVILRNTLSGKGEVQMPKCRDYWGEGRGELNGWLPFSSFFIPHRLQLLGPCGQGSFEAPTEQLSWLPVAAQNPLACWGQGGMKGNPLVPSVSFQGLGTSGLFLFCVAILKEERWERKIALTF